MGFFSGLVGGLLGGSSGGGSSSSTATTKNEVTVNPTTNIDIDFDIDALAEAIQSGNNQNASIELLKLKTSVELAQAEQNNNKQLIQQFTKINEFLPALIVGGGLYIFYKKGKK